VEQNSKYLVHLNTFLCEGTMHVVNRSKLNFLTFNSFCRHYALLIEKNDIGERESSILLQIYNYINPFLNLTKEEFMKYIYKFFTLSTEDILVYQRMVAYRRKFSID
jgi:hypothetical protein